MNFLISPRLVLLRVLLAMVPAAVVHAADEAPAAPPGASLQAIVMDVQGKARWRPSADGEWRDAKVNDIVDPGTEIRTGLKGRMTLRVGKNATVLVDSGTEFHLPNIVQEGETLRTLATVKSGRVDFKVDKVGFSNDFKVVTPATTLSVRGTGFSLSTGPLQGVEVSGVRTNMINAIEVKYAASNATYFMSGAAQTSSERQDPVHSAWVSTVGPPPVVGTLADKGQLSQQVSQGQSGNAPTNSQGAQQVSLARQNGPGGNSLILAAQDPAASDALKQLAIDVTGRTDNVDPPSGGGDGGGGDGGGGDGGGGDGGGGDGGGGDGGGGDGGGGDGGGGDGGGGDGGGGDGGGGDGGGGDDGGAPLSLLLTEELEFVRAKAPLILADIGALNAASEWAIGSGITSDAQSLYYQSGREDESSEDDRWQPSLKGKIRSSEHQRDLIDAVGYLHADASDPQRVSDGSPLAPMIERFEDWSETHRADRGRIFNSPYSEADVSAYLAEPGSEPSSDPRGTIAPLSVQWLENARSWSRADLAGMDGASLAAKEQTARYWTTRPDDDTEGRSPTWLAMQVNEAVQRRWDTVVHHALGGRESDLQASVSGGVMNMIDKLHDSALHDSELLSVRVGIDTYAEAFRIAANAEGTPAALAARDEVLKIIEGERGPGGEIIAPGVKAELDAAIAAAKHAAAEANNARTLSQRAFLSAASYRELRQAAEIANRCQEATMGTGGIVPNAFDMQDKFIQANRAAIASRLVAPDLATVRDGTRP